MKVFKFGGASLKDSNGVKNVASIIASQPSNNLLVVVSAMGKTTDMLERVLTLASSKQDHRSAVDSLKKYHHEIINNLFQNPSSVVHEVDLHFDDIEKELRSTPPSDQLYDQVVCKGELVSSMILHHYLLSKEISNS